MRRKQFTEEQIIGILKQAQAGVILKGEIIKVIFLQRPAKPVLKILNQIVEIMNRGKSVGWMWHRLGTSNVRGIEIHNQFKSTHRGDDIANFVVNRRMK